MNIEKVKKIFRNIPTQSYLVEVHYTNDDGNLEIRPGYLSGVEERRPDEVQETFRVTFQERHSRGTPAIELSTYLERNGCPRGHMSIPLEHVRAIYPLVCKREDILQALPKD